MITKIKYTTEKELKAKGYFINNLQINPVKTQRDLERFITHLPTKSSGVKEKKRVILNAETIEKLKDDFEEIDQIEDEKLEKLEKERNNISTNNVSLAKLFLTCFDIFKNGISKIEDNKELQRFLDNYDNVEELRSLIIDYGDGNQFGDHYVQVNINKFIIKERNQILELIDIFFQIFES